MDPTRRPEVSPEEAGGAVRAHRLKKGWTQTRLAKLSGVRRQFISDLESGRPSAKLEKALLVFEVVGIEVQGVRERAGRYAPDLHVDIDRHLKSFRASRGQGL
jgi:HTH-type transcriptional regulator/antitoxin HipB